MAKLFLETLSHYRSEGKYSLYEFVLMPDHFRLLVTPSEGIILERVMEFIKGGFSYRVGKELGLKMEIWERGYVDHRIRELTDFSNHVEYIRRKPVGAGLAAAPADYPCCSTCPGFDLDPVQGMAETRPHVLQVDSVPCCGLAENRPTPLLHRASCHNGMPGRPRWS
jgi:putative transposase